MNLLDVEKPARYMGGEMGSTPKNKADIRFALAFPDVYEVGMSHLGLRILYKALNDQEGIAAERVYAPWPDMAAALEADNEPLSTLESKTPLKQTDIIGFTLQYELSCTNILTMLRHAGIPWRAADRDAQFPLIIAGGPGAYNPEPIAPFFDAFLLGDGEEAVLEIAETVRKWKTDPARTKQGLLEELAAIKGIYIPSFFNTSYNPDGTVAAITPLDPKHDKVRRRFLSDLENAAYPDDPIIPFMKTIHDRVAIEIARGCTRGCRFCQAGYLYRPLRERSPERIKQLIRSAINASGYDEISLLSLSTGDYTCIAPLLQELMQEYTNSRVAVSLPSLRVGTLTPELIDEIKKVRKTGFTLAPEAGSERMRQVINKGITEADLIESAFNAYSAGWRSIKLYYMMGLPTETREDLQAIVDLSRQVKDQAKKAGGSGEANVAVSTFVPKPHTPFQWEPQLSLTETRDRQRFLKDALKRRKLNFKYQEAELSFMEGVIARGDRRLAAVLERAVELGCRFDGWREHFSLERWLQAFKEIGIDPEWYLRRRSHAEILPWDHLESGVSRQFLLTELERATACAPTPDCRTGSCSACGVCDHSLIKNRITRLPAAGQATTEHQADTENVAKRMRVRFSKTGQMKYLSHLELLNVYTRALHRAGIPILYSQGFHPHPRFSFATATSVGIESTAEYLDLFTGDMDSSEITDRLNRVLPEGLKIMEIVETDLKTASLSSMIQATRYRVHLDQSAPAKLSEQCVQFMAHESWQLVRQKKKQVQEFDLRQEVHELTPRGTILEMVLGRGKPLEVVEAVTGLSPDSLQHCLIEKTDVIFNSI
jgi:radical SAM family uncharacterized protein/radical SAM-linked protein